MFSGRLRPSEVKGFTSVASRGEESEKHRLENTVSGKEKKAQRLTFLGPETAARWGGGLPREGVVAEKFMPALESLSSLRFEGKNIWDVPGFLPGCPGPLAVFKKFVQKSSCPFSGPCVWNP